MKAQPLSIAAAVLLVAGGLWFAGSAWRRHASHPSSPGVDSATPGAAAADPTRDAHTPPPPDPNHPPGPDPTPRPPDPTRRFSDFTPEQRVQFARQGHGPGG